MNADKRRSGAIQSAFIRVHQRPIESLYWIAFAALMALVAAVFWRALFTSDTFFFRDISFAHFPRAVELRTLVRSGQLPIWNPFEHFGEPVSVNANYLLFYPTAWLAWMLPAAYGFKLHYLLHFFVLAAGAFLLARRIGLSPLACFLAGALFVFSGPIVSLGAFYNLLPAVAWMPLAVLAADYQMRRGGWKGAGALAGALTLQVFAGEPLTSLATAALALGWALAFHGDARAAAWAGMNRRVLGRFLLALLLAAGFSAIQVVPALWHMPDTVRGSFGFDQTLFWSLHPLKGLELVLPDFLGNPLYDSTPWIYLEGREVYFLLSLFIGIVPLALALLGIADCVRRGGRIADFTLRGSGSESEIRPPRRTQSAMFWAVVALMALLLALGRYTPLSYVFYYLIPIYRVVRFPVKFLAPFALAVAQLAAIAADRSLSDRAACPAGPTGRWLLRACVALALAWAGVSALILAAPAAARRLMAPLVSLVFTHTRALAIRQTLPLDRAEILAQANDWLLEVIPARLPYVLGSALLVTALLYLRRRGSLRPWLVWAAGGLAVLQLIGLHADLNPLAGRRYFDDRPPVGRYLDDAPRPLVAGMPGLPHRVFVEPALTPPTLASAFVSVDLSQVDFLPPAAQVYYAYRMSLQSGAGLLGLEGTFTADPEHILANAQETLNHAVYDMGLAGEQLARLLRVAGVEYAVLLRYSAPAGLELIGAFPNATTTPARLYRVRGAMPRAYLAPAAGAAWLPPGEAAIRRMLAPDFDPASQVVLDPATGAGQVPAAAPSTFIGQARILERQAGRVAVETDANQAAWLVLNDSYNAGWKVSLDGKPAPLLRANQMFRAVAVPPGRHQVVFRYRPPALLIGAAISLASALLAALAAAIGRKRGSAAV